MSRVSRSKAGTICREALWITIKNRQSRRRIGEMVRTAEKRERERERNIVTNLDATKRLIHKWGCPGISSGSGVMRVCPFVHGAGRTGVYR